MEQESNGKVAVGYFRTKNCKNIFYFSSCGNLEVDIYHDNISVVCTCEHKTPVISIFREKNQEIYVKEFEIKDNAMIYKGSTIHSFKSKGFRPQHINCYPYTLEYSVYIDNLGISQAVYMLDHMYAMLLIMMAIDNDILTKDQAYPELLAMREVAASEVEISARHLPYRVLSKNSETNRSILAYVESTAEHPSAKKEHPADKKEHPADKKESHLCVICQQYEPCYIMIPCGHLCLCGNCQRQIEKMNHQCPICRAHGDLHKVYRP